MRTGKAEVLTELLDMPPSPVRLEMPALVTRLAICLHAREMLLSTVASSLVIVPFRSSCRHEWSQSDNS